MIDKNGKLFGKINIIDIITILVIAIVLVFAYGEFKKLTGLETRVLDDIEFEFYQEETNDFIAEDVKVGDIAIDSWTNSVIGEVKDIKVDRSVSWPLEGYGDMKPSDKEGYKSIRIVVDSKGTYGDNGVNIDGKDFYVGETIRLKVGQAIFYGEVSGLEKVEVKN